MPDGTRPINDRTRFIADLQRVGEALHGRVSPSYLAPELDVSERTIRHWLDGEKFPHNPDDVRRVMREALERRSGAVRALIRDLG